MLPLSPWAQKIRKEGREKNDAIQKKRGIPVANEYELDLWIFGVLPMGHACKHEFLLRCYQHQWPTLFEVQKDGLVNYWVVARAKALCQHRFISFAGCASSGKSFDSAAYCYTRWKSRPFATSAYFTTTSASAGEDRSWGAVKELHAKDEYKIGKRIESLRLITLDAEVKDDDGNSNRDVRNAIKVVLIKPGAEGRNVAQSVIGRKNDFVIWCADEFQFLDLGILDARINLISNDFFQFIGLGNGPREGDPLYLDAEPYGPDFPAGWKSIDLDSGITEWPTRNGICLHFDGHKSPNLHAPVGKPSPFKSILNAEKMEIMKRAAGGDDTPMYWNQVRGFPPLVDIPDKIITQRLLETHGAYKTAVWLGSETTTLAGLDLGFREGGDPCVVHFGKIGREFDHEHGKQSKTVLELERDTVILNPRQSDGQDFETQISVRCIEECEKRGCHDLALDVTGDGGMILQALERVSRQKSYRLTCIPISFAGQADDRIVIQGEKRTGRQMFDRMVSQLWASFRVSVINGVIRNANAHSRAIQQACQRKYLTDEKKRMSVEPKREMKKRIKRSPDDADSLMLLHAIALRHGLSGEAAAVLPKPSEVAATQEASRGYSGFSQKAAYGGR